MRFNQYSHRHGKEILQLTHKQEMDEIFTVLQSLHEFKHGATKGETVKGVIASEFKRLGWETEFKIDLGTGKTDKCDLLKNRVAIEQEYSRFEMFFRDFFRFLLLYDKRKIDAGVIITYDESAFEHWGEGVDSYRSARASLGRLTDFLEGEYATVVKFPLWCIGIE